MIYLASSFEQNGLTLKLKRAFHVADKDDDGQLSYDEVYGGKIGNLPQLSWISVDHKKKQKKAPR